MLISGKGITFRKRLGVQSGSKECLLLYTYPYEFTEELTFQMGRFSLSFPLPLCRVIPSPIGIYKTTESFNSLVKKTESLKTGSYRLSKQYFSDGSIKEKIRDR